MKVKLSDLAVVKKLITVAEDQEIEIRALSLQEMVELFLQSTDMFLAMYTKVQEVGSSAEKLAPLLVGAPDFVAQAIAMATDEPLAIDNAKRLAPSVQLIAAYEIWKMSVPDPKALGGLLSVVTAELRRLSPNAGQNKPVVIPPQTSQMESVASSNSSLQTDTVKSESGNTV